MEDHEYGQYLLDELQKKLDDLKVDKAEVHYDEEKNKTIISYPSFSGEALIEWNEK